jgi:hypothetical protein
VTISSFLQGPDPSQWEVLRSGEAPGESPLAALANLAEHARLMALVWVTQADAGDGVVVALQPTPADALALQQVQQHRAAPPGPISTKGDKSS